MNLSARDMPSFNVELPFPVREKLRRRLSTGQVQIYRDIALTKGHIGKALEGVKDALFMGSVEAARLADIMRQIDISAAGSLNRDDFYLALDRTGVSLQAEDKYRLFEALQIASSGRGCDIEMSAHLIKFWAGNDGCAAPLAPPKDARDKYAKAKAPLLPSTKPDEVNPSIGRSAGASMSGHSAAIRNSASRGEAEREVDRGAVVPEQNASSKVIGESLDELDGEGDKEPAVRSHEPTVVDTKNFHYENANDVFHHAATAAGAENRRAPVQRCDVTLASNPPVAASTPSKGVLHNSEDRDKNNLEDVGGSRPSSERRRMNGTGFAHSTEKKLPDQAYMNSMEYGNLSSVLSILLDRRGTLEAFIQRLDRTDTGRVKTSDFMAAVREVGVALSPLQEANLMDMLERMDVVSPAEGGYRWIDIEAGLAAVALAGEKACGTIFRKKAALIHEEGTRLLDTISAHYPEVHIALLPSALLLGPNALREHRAALSDGADNVIVTTGSLQRALRTSRVLIRDSGKRILWQLLLSRAQDLLRRNSADDNDKATSARFLDSGLIPLPILDKVMDFDAEGTLRVRRELQEQKVSPASIPPGYAKHSWVMGAWTSAAKNDEEKERNTLLRRVRLRVNGLAETAVERERLLLQCLPKLGPTGERQHVLRNDLIRLLQQLRVGVRCGELQNLWYHMDKNKVTREGFRRLLMGSLDSPLAAFPGSPRPYPVGPSAPAFETSHDPNRTPPGGDSVSGARAQRELNRAAYKDNTRHAEGSAIPQFVREEEGQRETNSPESSRSMPSAAISSEFEAANEMPVLLRRAVDRVKEMENGEEAVWALVPNTGRAREGIQITRGDIQRALHGLDVIPHSGELQQLWWYLERGTIGDPRISVETFRALLQGQITELELLPQWSVLEVERSPSSISDEKNAPESSGKGVTRAAKAALGLVRKRVGGIIRECNHRDLSSDGCVTEGSFLAVVNELGILRQLGNIGLTALRQAVVVDVDLTNGRRATAAVRYSGLMGAIDRYLEVMASWDEAEAASRLCADVDVGGKDIEARCSESQEHTPQHQPQVSELRTPVADQNGDPNKIDTISKTTLCSPTPSRWGTRRVGVKDSQDNMARATRGWENDAPVVPLGMRHFAQKSCKMAALIRQVPIDGSAGVVPRTTNAKGRVPPSRVMGTSIAITDALGRGKGTSSEATAARPAAPNPSFRDSYTAPSMTPGMRDALMWESKVDGHATRRVARSSLQSKNPRSLSDERHRAYADFVPAGGASSIERPVSCGARRGMVNKISNLSGTDVSRAICWVEESDEQRAGRTEDPLIGSAGIAGDDVDSPNKYSHRDGAYGFNAITDNKLQESQLMRCRRRRQSNTGQVREVMQARPEIHNNADKSNVLGTPIPKRDPDRRRKIAKSLLSDRALLDGVFKQLAGIRGSQAPDELDRARLVKLLEYPRLPFCISHREAEDLADDVLTHDGAPAVRLASLISFLAKEVDATHARAGQGEGASYDEATPSWQPRSLQNDPIAQSIKSNVLQGHSDLRLAGGDAEDRLAEHLYCVFRKRRKDLETGPDGNDSSNCSVSASGLSGVLKDMGVVFNPNQTAFLIERCGTGKTPGRRVSAGGKDEAPVRAGDMLSFFRELFSAD